MNPLTLFLYVLLVIGPSQALSQVETILAAGTNETIDTQVLTTLKDQLQERLDRSAFKPDTVDLARKLALGRLAYPLKVVSERVRNDGE